MKTLPNFKYATSDYKYISNTLIDRPKPVVAKPKPAKSSPKSRLFNRTFWILFLSNIFFLYILLYKFFTN